MENSRGPIREGDRLIPDAQRGRAEYRCRSRSHLEQPQLGRGPVGYPVHVERRAAVAVSPAAVDAAVGALRPAADGGSRWIVVLGRRDFGLPDDAVGVGGLGLGGGRAEGEEQGGQGSEGERGEAERGEAAGAQASEVRTSVRSRGGVRVSGAWLAARDLHSNGNNRPNRRDRAVHRPHGSYEKPMRYARRSIR